MEPPRYHHLSGLFRLRSLSSVLTSGTCRGASQCTTLYGSEKSGNCSSETLWPLLTLLSISSASVFLRMPRPDVRPCGSVTSFAVTGAGLRLSVVSPDPPYFCGCRLCSGTSCFFFLICFPYLTAFLFGDISPERVWAISIARLRRYRRYTCDLSTSSSLTALVWRSYLEGGFVLRCFQHLSLPDAATRRCPWRDNRRTGGLSNTVLSY